MITLLERPTADRAALPQKVAASVTALPNHFSHVNQEIQQ